MSKTWFDIKGKKRTANINMLDTPFDDTSQSTYTEGGPVEQKEIDFIDPWGVNKKGKKPMTSVTAGGGS